MDTDDGSPQRGNAAKKNRGKSDTNNGAGYKDAEKRSAKTDTKDCNTAMYFLMTTLTFPIFILLLFYVQRLSALTD